MSSTRCAKCGELIENEADAANVSTGKYAGAQPLTEATQWGVFHKSCFNRAIGTPESVMDEMRRLSKDVK